MGKAPVVLFPQIIDYILSSYINVIIRGNITTTNNTKRVFIDCFPIAYFQSSQLVMTIYSLNDRNNDRNKIG